MAVIGWILLGILGFLLFLFLLILFFPISYCIEGRKAKSDPAVLSAKVKWLFGFVRVLFDFPKPGKIIVKIGFVTVYGRDKKEKQHCDSVESNGQSQHKNREPNDQLQGNAEQNGQARLDNVEPNTQPGNVGSTEQQENDGQNEKPQPCDLPEQDEHPTMNGQHETAKEVQDQEQSKDHEPNLPKAKKQSPIESIRHMKDRVLKEYHFYKRLWQDDDTKPFVKETLARVLHILKNLLPKKLYGNLRFGAASPDITGYVYGVYCIISSFFTKRFGLAFDPDFENEILEGKIQIKGSFCTIVLLWDGLRIFFDRRLRKIKRRIEHHQNKMSKAS